ncbi:Acyl-protein thioesterase 1 [Tolypocladium ophioglossoides CBS 100239]|uniref:Acyl-protein thioesterase 1 n=1 Tax=Tolypocladium ophioglossoides (strain CBS 100239) TaxID=1163406 RepID=A0A0L0N0V1_TOLOC|nr:Acyl-protein thioesterase 1 [Tolypocladium ophioglossoides CBS 100239]
MSFNYPDPVVFHAKGEHTATVIFCHGLGFTAHSWAIYVEGWRRNGELDGVRWVLPNGPTRSLTANAGMDMTAWFDIKVFDGTPEALRRDEDIASITASKDYVQSLIQREIDAGVPPERIILGGFSQGAVVASFAGLTFPQKLGGIVLLSSWLPTADTFRDYIPEEHDNRDTHVFMGHGVEDRLVIPAMGKKSFDDIGAMGFSNVKWEVYPGMEHTTCPDELEDVELFIEDRLAE